MQLAYTVVGSGPPVLLIHGFGAHTYAWRHISPKLAADHRVYALDLKGFGESPKPLDNAYSLHDQAALVRRFIEAHDLRNLTIIGHSLGGGVALVTALDLLDEPNPRLSRLILIDGIAYRQRLPFFIHSLRVPVIGPLAVHLIPAESQARYVLAATYYRDDRITNAQVAEYAKPLRTPGARHALLATAKQIVPRDIHTLERRYKSITVPTLIIWGKHDTLVPLDLGKQLRQDIVSSRLVVINDCGHAPHEECPLETTAAISDFLMDEPVPALPSQRRSVP